jgi:hypothetical protein
MELVMPAACQKGAEPANNERQSDDKETGFHQQSNS